MSDHDANVAAVLAEAIANKRFLGRAGTEAEYCDELARYVLAAITAENFAVVKLPEGVEVEHGARLVPRTVNLANMEVDLYAIEDTP